MPNLAKQLQIIVNKYIEAEQPWPASTHDIARWAIHQKLWHPKASSFINECADQLSRAMREEHIIDPQGRVIRAKHVAKMSRNGKQIALWGDIRTASHQHMEIAFQQRRNQIVGDCKQLKTDVDSYNENRIPRQPIQIVFDFTNDIEESEIASNY